MRDGRPGYCWAEVGHGDRQSISRQPHNRPPIDRIMRLHRNWTPVAPQRMIVNREKNGITGLPAAPRNARIQGHFSKGGAGPAWRPDVPHSCVDSREPTGSAAGRDPYGIGNRMTSAASGRGNASSQVVRVCPRARSPALEMPAGRSFLPAGRVYCRVRGLVPAGLGRAQFSAATAGNKKRSWQIDPSLCHDLYPEAEPTCVPPSR